MSCCGDKDTTIGGDAPKNASVPTKKLEDLSHIGKAAISEMEIKHPEYKNKLWAVTRSKIIGTIGHGPKNAFTDGDDPPPGHSEWLPTEMADLLSKTEKFCDFMSLAPPDEIFLEKIKEALKIVAARAEETEEKIVVRFLFGSIIAVPVNCHAVIQDLTEGISTDSKLEVYVGAWRKGMCWNHAKIVAVDGKYLFTGGHNLWTKVYLEDSPIHDTSIHLEGPVTVEAHLFANDQWKFIEENQRSIKGWIIDKLPDGLPLPLRVRVTISEWPEGKASTFAPDYRKPLILPFNGRGSVPVLALGRYGNIHGDHKRASDDAFIAMFDAAQTSIRFLLQDLGPVNKTIAGKRIVYKDWPENYMKAMGRAIWERGVDIEIALSNPDAAFLEIGNYSNGWPCADVASEIIKLMKEQFPEATEAELRQKVSDNLRICSMKNKGGKTDWDVQQKVALHSKFFIVDDVLTYVGSQNLYMFDLAEWGVAIDSKEETAKIMTDLWEPMWESSYGNGEDCNVDEVMDGLGIDRGPTEKLSDRELAKLESDAHLDQLKETKFYTSEDEDGEYNEVEGAGGCIIS